MSHKMKSMSDIINPVLDKYKKLFSINISNIINKFSFIILTHIIFYTQANTRERMTLFSLNQSMPQTPELNQILLTKKSLLVPFEEIKTREKEKEVNETRPILKFFLLSLNPNIPK